MDKIIYFLLAPSLLLSWEAPPQSTLLAKSDNQNDQNRHGSRDDSRGPQGDQNTGKDTQSQIQQPQNQQSRGQDNREIKTMDTGRDTQTQIQPILNKSPRGQEVREIKTIDIDQDKNQRRDRDDRRDHSDEIQQNWKTNKYFQKPVDRDLDHKQDWKDKRDDVKTFPTEDRNPSKYNDGQFSKERFKDKENRWQSRGKEWRRDFSEHRSRDHVFDNHFWNDFRRNNKNWHFDDNFQWYTGANWSNIVVWLPWQWKRPIYYYYDNNNVYYSTSEDYTSLSPVSSKENFIAQAARIANGQYPISNQQSYWMPLGMFSIASDNDSAPKRYLSLAISKQGAVSGANYDQANNTTLEIQGGIDPESQRIAWKFLGKDWPIMESGLYNLTKEESTLLIHTSPNTSETELLIKLDS